MISLARVWHHSWYGTCNILLKQHQGANNYRKWNCPKALATHTLLLCSGSPPQCSTDFHYHDTYKVPRWIKKTPRRKQLQEVELYAVVSLKRTDNFGCLWTLKWYIHSVHFIDFHKTGFVAGKSCSWFKHPHLGGIDLGTRGLVLCSKGIEVTPTTCYELSPTHKQADCVLWLGRTHLTTAYKPSVMLH